MRIILQLLHKYSYYAFIIIEIGQTNELMPKHSGQGRKERKAKKFMSLFCGCGICDNENCYWH